MPGWATTGRAHPARTPRRRWSSRPGPTSSRAGHNRLLEDLNAAAKWAGHEDAADELAEDLRDWEAAGRPDAPAHAEEPFNGLVIGGLKIVRG